MTTAADDHSAMPPRPVNVVPHTHWDREWYAPFQHFRARLVELLDGLLPRLEADPSFRHFLLDGQLAVVDDYLAVRPAERARLSRLVAEGRLAIGPWYTLPDEFLVSGETLVRNLQLGLRRAATLGGAMGVGYLPDMFGHIAQMPQLLRLFGMTDAVVWRGVPAELNGTGFDWEAPDGSTVRAQYLPGGYGAGAAMPLDPTRFLARIEGWIDRFAELLGDEPVLWMNGSDHRLPQAGLPAAIGGANALAAGRVELRISSLPEHLATVRRDGLPRWHGELRSGARANLLMGVISNRTDVRVAAARAELAIEQLAEPVATAWLPADRWPGALLEEAWLALCHNAAHDSVGACSDDEVVATVLDRYAQARQIGEAIVGSALRHVAGHLAHNGPVVLNPSPVPRGGLVTVRFPGAEPWPGAQPLNTEPPAEQLAELPLTQALAVYPEVISWTDGVHGVDVDLDEDTAVVTVHLDSPGGRTAPTYAAIEAALVAAGVQGAHTVRATVRRPAVHTALVHVAAVPALGWCPATPPVRTPLPAPPPVVAGARTLANGLVTVEVAADGTFAVDGVAGLGRLVDGGDRGDTYNYCPPEADRFVDEPVAVDVDVAERGPLRGRLLVHATYSWPAGVSPDGRQRVGDIPVEVHTALELHAGENFLRVTVELDNRGADHRLRAHFPLPRRATTSHAECAFAVVERGLHAEGGPTEEPLATFPSRRFVRAGGLTIAHLGLHEYELIDLDERGQTAGTLALTLLRATGALSRGPMPTRPLPAGPAIALHGAQCPGLHRLRYALAVGDVDPDALVTDAFVPLLVANGTGDGDLPPVTSGLAVQGAMVSAVRRADDGQTEVRAVARRAGPLTIAGWEGRVVDLAGRDQGPFDGRIDLRSTQIVTLRIRPRAER